MPQLALAFESAPQYHAEDFMVSGANRLAHAQLTAWPSWSAYGFYLWGPKGSGKTHLAHVWHAQSQAAWKSADALSEADLALAQSPKPALVLDDIERCTQPEMLFHLLNLFKEHQGSLLLTGNAPITLLPFTLADLRSRLLALPRGEINAPDDALLRAILGKQFADRQLRVSPEVADYILARCERSIATLCNFVEELDRAALRDQRAISVPYVRALMEGR